MKITSINNFTIMQGKDFKQIYDNKNHRMLQIMGTKVEYVDTHLMKGIKSFIKILKEIK